MNPIFTACSWIVLYIIPTNTTLKVEQVDGFFTTEHTAGGGVDGQLYFRIYQQDELQSIAIEVKGGEMSMFGIYGRYVGR